MHKWSPEARLIGTTFLDSLVNRNAQSQVCIPAEALDMYTNRLEK